MVYVGNGIARNVLKIYAGDGVAREVAKGYIGDANNIARLAYTKAPAGLPIFNLPVGALVSAPLDGVPTLIRLLHHGSPSSLYNGFEDTTTFMFENIIENRQWHSSNNNNYAGSTIHTYQNGAFLTRVGFANQLKQVRIPYRPGTSGTTINSGANGLPAFVWLLSGYEVNWTSATNQYFPADGATFSYFAGTAATDAKRIGYLGGTATVFFLRSPPTQAAANSWCVNLNGSWTSAPCSSSHGFRPAFALPNTAMVDPTPNPDGSYTLLVA